MRLKIFWYLICDYLYAFYKQASAFIFPRPPARYLSGNKNSIVIIPGVFEKWHFLKPIADTLSAEGHPIYSLDNLGYNTKEISKTAKLVDNFIEKNNLRDVVIIAHSKGGLIGKYVLAFYNNHERVKKLIAIAAPFGGSGIVKFVPFKLLGLAPNSEAIKILRERNDVNNKR